MRRREGTYDAFVLLRYPREEAERESGRLRSLEAESLHGAHEALRRGDAARDRGEAGAALSAYVEAMTAAGETATAAALRTRVLERLTSVLAGLRTCRLPSALRCRAPAPRSRGYGKPRSPHQRENGTMVARSLSKCGRSGPGERGESPYGPQKAHRRARSGTSSA